MNIYYKVTWGDTLEKIAQMYDTDVETLNIINKTTDFYVGQLIRITYYRYYITFDKNTLKRSLIYCLKRHANKRRYYRIV